MSITLAVALYFIIWWTLLFAVLPWGVRTQGETGEVVPGTPASAPSKPRIAWVLGVNTLVSAIVLSLVWAAITFEWLPVPWLGGDGG